MAGIESVQKAINAEMATHGLTRAQFARQIGVDAGTLGDLLDGKRRPKAPTQGKIERHFGWPAGTVAEVLAGRSELPDVSPVGEALAGVLLDLNPDAYSDLEPAERDEAIAAAKVTFLERARQIRRSREN